MLFLMLLTAGICFQGINCMHIPDGLEDNDITTTKSTDWVKISQQPITLINKPTGARIELDCEAVGSPPPQIQWFHGKTPVGKVPDFENNLISEMPTQGMAKVRARLVIHSANANIHDGMYTCVAESGSKVKTAKSKVHVVRNAKSDDNGTGQVMEQFFAIRSPPVIILYDTIYMDNIGSDVLLPCTTIGSPLPTVMWLDPSESVIDESTDPRIRVLPSGELSIRNIRWKDMGPYTCVARNNLGQDNVTTFLYPMLAEK